MENIESKELLSALNESQIEVVTTTKGPVLVLAGAGSGKTRSVIHRVAWLILKENVKPWNILVVTFTNKAAEELQERLSNLFQFKMRSAWVGTFHAVCTRILRYEIIHLPEYTSSFTIFNRDDQLSLLKKVFDLQKIDKKAIPPEKMLNIISKQKSNVILPENFFQFQERNKYTEIFHSLYSQYNETLKLENAMDFDDLLMNTALLFQYNHEIKLKYQDQFKYIMVDEYQDTNFVQFRIMRLLAESHQNICVVGDDDQGIYGWRGANIENILSFHNDYQNVKIIKLEQNYRSSKNILNLANQLITHNTRRHQKELWSNYVNDFIPQLIEHDNEHSEASFIAELVAEKIKEGVSPSEIVILYRTNFQSRIFESIFSAQQIKYQVIGSFGFFKRAEIKDMIAWLRFLVNPDDMEAFLRVVNTPTRGIGKTSIQNLYMHSFQHNKSIIKTLEEVETINSLTPGAKKALKKFYVLVRNLHFSSDKMILPDIVKLIINECGLLTHYEMLDQKDMTDKVENIQEFITATTEFDIEFTKEHDTHPNLNDYLNSLSLASDIDDYDGKKETAKLMTMHCAKGLEFEYVIVAGLEEGILPHSLCLEDPNQIEEERRLLYVAITRAKKEVYLNFCHSRRVAGKIKYQNPSRFLHDLCEPTIQRINASFYEMRGLFKQPPKKDHSFIQNEIINETKDRSFYPKDIPQKTEVIKINLKPKPNKIVLESEKHFKIGMIVEHEEYGTGTILSVDGAGPNAKLTISFHKGGLKKIHGKWIKIVDS